MTPIDDGWARTEDMYKKGKMWLCRGGSSQWGRMGIRKAQSKAGQGRNVTPEKAES